MKIAFYDQANAPNLFYFIQFLGKNALCESNENTKTAIKTMENENMNISDLLNDEMFENLTTNMAFKSTKSTEPIQPIQPIEKVTPEFLPHLSTLSPSFPKSIVQKSNKMLEDNGTGNKNAGDEGKKSQKTIL